MAKEQLPRYVWLIDTIYRHKRITLEDLSNLWQKNSLSNGEPLKRRNFINDRRAVEELFDICIECDASTGYEYYIEDKECLESSTVNRWMMSTLAVNNLLQNSKQLKERIILEDIPSGQTHLMPIIEAMRDGIRLEIVHQRFADSLPRAIRVDPYCVKVFERRWYLIGNKTPTDKEEAEEDRARVANGESSRFGIRTFALDRILSVTPTEIPFVYPESFSPQAYFQHCLGVTTCEEATIIRFKVYGHQVAYFRTLPLHGTQTEIESTDEYTLFEVYLRPNYEVEQALLAQGGDVEVVSPEWFRQEMKGYAEAMVKRYQCE